MQAYKDNSKTTVKSIGGKTDGPNTAVKPAIIKSIGFQFVIKEPQ